MLAPRSALCRLLGQYEVTVEARELPKEGCGRNVICTGRFLTGRKSAKFIRFASSPYSGTPFVSSGIPASPLERMVGKPVTTVLRTSCQAKIFASAIKTVTVSVIYLQPVRRRHDQAMKQYAFAMFRKRGRSSVVIFSGGAATPSTPLKLQHKVGVGVIEKSELTFCEGDFHLHAPQYQIRWAPADNLRQSRQSSRVGDGRFHARAGGGSRGI